MRPLLLAVLLAACGTAPPGEVDDCARSISLPGAVSTDILFVIDDSGSMTEEQRRVADELGAFVSVLLDAPVENDFQVGVTSTSVTSHTAGCTDDPRLASYDGAGELVDPPGDGPRFLHRGDPDFLDRFEELVELGIRGSGQEMPLEAMRRVLEDPPEGFLRPGARLLVVIVTDEDDCSDPTADALVNRTCNGERCDVDADCGGAPAYCIPRDLVDRDGPRVCRVSSCETAEGRAALEPVSSYVEFLRGLDRDVALAVIAPVDPSTLAPARCSSATDEAYGSGVRLREAALAFGGDGLLASICSEGYGEALQAAAALVAAPGAITLEDAPADPRFVQIEIRRGGERIDCRAGDGFTYERDGHDARVILDGACRLRPGDRVVTKLICAG